MDSHDLAQSSPGVTAVVHENSDQKAGADVDAPQTPVDVVHDVLPPATFSFLRGLTPFWHDRLIEAGLILSMGLYYVVGNTNLGAGSFLHIPPYLYSFPFLAIFACLSWYRLPFAVALLPLALPYYFTQKTVFSYGSHHLDFGLGEITVAVCAFVAIGQMLLYGRRWRYWLSWAEMRQRLGPFSIPILIFVAAALVSIVIAVERATALRAFREEVFDPLIYLLLVLCCLRTRQDLQRLVGAFFGSALVIAVIGLLQYVLVPVHPQQLSDGNRAHAVYGSANSIGLFFDYILPFGMALLIWQVGQALRVPGKWWPCVLILIACVPLIGVLVFSQSLGTALALPIALLFILALSIRQRKTLLIGAGVLLALGLIVGVVLHRPLTNFLAHWHDNGEGISTVTKRYYLWLTALSMIRHHAVFGVGMDNWLCYYSLNDVCHASHIVNAQYWIKIIPGTNLPTGLADEPTLSHPHDIFLQIWASIGIFGLLVFF
ncbi:MAG: O-antigen ligase family protein [Ktedonobacteraceae bacterium]